MDCREAQSVVKKYMEYLVNQRGTISTDQDSFHELIRAFKHIQSCDDWICSLIRSRLKSLLLEIEELKKLWLS